MTERWSFPVAQAMQRHTGCRYVKPKVVPQAGPQEPPPQEADAAHNAAATIEPNSER